MKSKVRLALAMLGIGLLSTLYAACGSEAPEDPQPPVPGRPAAPAAQPAPYPDTPTNVEAPPMVQQQPAPAAPARAPKAPAPAEAPAAEVGAATNVRRLVDIDSMAMEAGSSGEDSNGETTTAEASQTADVQKNIKLSNQSMTKAIEDASNPSEAAPMTSLAGTPSQAEQSASQLVAGAAPAGAPLPPNGGALPPSPTSPPTTDYDDDGYVSSQPPAYDTTFFQNYGVNPFIDTRADHLSTFAMNVDTTSYSVARRFVLDGNTPDPDSVRVEEFVNYFDQEYPQPNEGAFAIHVDGARSPFTGDTWIARVGIQGRDVPDHKRKDATLVFVIDTSGSMSRENRLELVKRALRLLVRELRPTDQIGIVTYGDRGHAVLFPTEARHDDYILGVLDQLHTGGSTNAEEGLRLGYEMADRWLDPERIARIILLSDGVANVGRTGPEGILSQVRQYVNEGVTLSTVGVGMGNYNDVLMEQLANDGDGNYVYIDNLTEAWKSFVDNLTSTLQVIAKDAKIQVSFNPDVVHSYRLVGYENRDVADRDFRNDSVDAGEVGAGHSVTALYELRLNKRFDGPIAKVHVRYEEPDTRQIHEVGRNLNVSELHEYFEGASPRFQLAATVAQFAEVLRRSYWAQHTTLDEVRWHADRVGGILHNDPEVTDFARLVGMMARLGDG